MTTLRLRYAMKRPPTAKPPGSGQLLPNYLSGQLNEAAFRRHFLEQRWFVPADWRAFTPRQIDLAGRPSLICFSSPDAQELARQQLGEASVGGATLEMCGFQLVESLPANVELLVDFGSEHSLAPDHGLLRGLRELAGAIAVETALQVIATGTAQPKAWRLLKRFGDFRLLAEAGSGSHTLLLAPDRHRRPLAAVFTADDAVTAFLQQARSPITPPQVIRCDGESLCQTLSSTPVHGVVFNCCGPGVALPFSSALFDRVLRF